MQASVIYIPEDIYSYPEEAIGDEENYLSKLQASTALADYLASKAMKRGDVIVVCPEDGYRNDYRFMFDGVNICCLCYKAYNYGYIYDYGIVPEQFVCITEFPIGYWDSALRAWNMVWIPFSDQIHKELLGNMAIYDREKAVYHSTATIADKLIDFYLCEEESVIAP